MLNGAKRSASSGLKYVPITTKQMISNFEFDLVKLIVRQCYNMKYVC